MRDHSLHNAIASARIYRAFVYSTGQVAPHL